MEKKITLTSTALDIITTITTFVGGEIETTNNELCIISNKEGKEGYIQINFKDKEVGFVDMDLDTKTYFAVVGFAACRNYTTEDYFLG